MPFAEEPGGEKKRVARQPYTNRGPPPKSLLFYCRCPMHQLKDALHGLRKKHPQERMRTVDSDEEEPTGDMDLDTEGGDMEKEEEPDFPRHSRY